MCFKAHFENCSLTHDTIAIGGVRGAYFGLARSGSGSPPLFSLAFVTRQNRLPPASSPDMHLASICRLNPAFGRLVADATVRERMRANPWLASGPMDPGIRTIYKAGRFFVGNAAGEVHALVGEGITLALRGAALLAESLTLHGLANADTAGQAYAAAWKKEFAPRYHASNLFTNLLIRPALAATAAHFLSACPPLLGYAIARSGKW
jgi:2-polyprenyl-6-methoxyphenol hydroxylase-like FAD-dependent oxidoreductase